VEGNMVLLPQSVSPAFQQLEGEGELNTALLPPGAGLIEHRCTHHHPGCLPRQTLAERISLIPFGSCAWLAKPIA